MNKSNRKTPPPIYVASGGKGLAGNNMVQSLLIQYPNNNIPVIIIPGVSSEKDVFNIIKEAKKTKGLVTHTFVNPDLRKKINQLGEEHGVRIIDFMSGLASYLDEQLNIKPLKHPGLYRKMHHKYFDRIEAIEFTLSHDDGMDPERLHHAEIILTGVSRAGKTPLSVYLTMYGWKVANIPLVNGIQPPKELFEVDPKRVFGLSIGAPQLIAHRKKRLMAWNNMDNTVYIDEKSIREEIRHAMFIFERGGFSVVNVSNKPIESTANEILNMMSERFAFRGRRIESPYHDSRTGK